MTTQQKAGVDVLAMLDRHAVGLRTAPRLTVKQDERVSDELREARAAVAELIEADKEYNIAKQCWDVAKSSPDGLSEGLRTRLFDEYEVAIARRADALARVGGAA